MAKEQWDLRSNVKNKPNAQGTLFSGGAAQMNPEKRYKKGYTPERQHAVGEALRGWGVNDYRTPEYDLPRDQHDYRPDLGPHALAALETLKKSSIPPEHLKNLRINVVDRHDEGSGAIQHGLDEDVLGEYHALSRKTVMHTTVAPGSVWGKQVPRKVVTHGEINVGHDSGPWTLIHEVGHHVSGTTGTPHSEYNDAHTRGSEEAFADNYADKHATPAMAKKGRGRENYEPLDDQHDGRPGEFHSGYDLVRGPVGTRPMNHWDRHEAAYQQKQQHAQNNPTLPGLERTN